MLTEPLLPEPGPADADASCLAPTGFEGSLTCDAEWPDVPGRMRVAVLGGSAALGVAPARTCWTWTAGADLTPAAR